LPGQATPAIDRAIMDAVRRRPEDFLELLERAKRGRLKVYIGSVAGVGKTYRMLQEAHALNTRGVDVVLGYIETHGRADTAALTPGLELVPRRVYAYRGVGIEEMDVDAILARRPQICVVDELAHTNVPLCRNRRRYQDVLEILEAGINVLCAFNVQHLESLNDLVERVTGVTVRETIPDSFLETADQVVNIDLTAEDLQDRLRAGKIYPAAKVEWALQHFFKAENLSTLRELALREVAESIDRSAETRARAALDAKQGAKSGAQASGRVMVCLPVEATRARILLRRGSRLAGRLNTSWFVVLVETPELAPDQIDAETQRLLYDNVRRAEELGAEVVRLKAKDPVPALIEFARGHRVAHLMLGRSRSGRFQRALGRSTMYRLIEAAEGFDVHICSVDEG
jgi:two-component system sensor histidine kinase KdpD